MIVYVVNYGISGIGIGKNLLKIDELLRSYEKENLRVVKIKNNINFNKYNTTTKNHLARLLKEVE